MSEIRDPYIDPDPGILRNLLGVSTQDALNDAEADLTEGETNDAACQTAGESRDLDPLIKLFDRITSDAE